MTYDKIGLYRQFIIVVSECERAVVLLSENYNDTLRSMSIFKKYIMELI